MNAGSAPPIGIAFCITQLEPGGAERALVELVERLDRRQFEPVVYCLGPRPVGNPTSLADRLEQAGASVHCLGARRLVQAPWILRRLARRMAADAPEIVQTFLFHANVLGALAARRSGVPHVVSGIRVAEHRYRWHLALARWSDRWVERHVCVSQAVQDFSRARGRLPQQKLIVIPNGVDVARFAAARPCDLAAFGVEAGHRVITHVGRLDEQKGATELVRLMPQVLQKFDEHDLLLVGAGPQRASLERLTRELGLDRRVHFAGFRDDVPEILAASDLLVLASQWEGMPNVVLEAMAAGKPVVASGVEGVAELLGASAAQIAPAGNPQVFAEKVTAILQNPALAAQLGSQNRRRAEQLFSLEAMAAAYQQLYRSLLDANS